VWRRRRGHREFLPYVSGGITLSGELIARRVNVHMIQISGIVQTFYKTPAAVRDHAYPPAVVLARPLAAVRGALEARGCQSRGNASQQADGVLIAGALARQISAAECVLEVSAEPSQPKQFIHDHPQ
jgi:hypothetical protein